MIFSFIIVSPELNFKKSTKLYLRLGTYAIISELVEVPYERHQYTWVFYTKTIGYIVSILCLVAFIVTIQLYRFFIYIVFCFFIFIY